VCRRVGEAEGDIRTIRGDSDAKKREVMKNTLGSVIEKEGSLQVPIYSVSKARRRSRLRNLRAGGKST